MGIYIYPVTLVKKVKNNYGHEVWEKDDFDIDADRWPNKSHRLIVGDNWEIPCECEGDQDEACTDASYYRPVDIPAAIERVTKLRDANHPFIPILELMKTRPDVYFELS